MGRLAAGMATANDDHIEIRMFHVKHSLFAETETRKYHVEDGFDIGFSDKRIERPEYGPNVLGDQDIVPTTRIQPSNSHPGFIQCIPDRRTLSLVCQRGR